MDTSQQLSRQKICEKHDQPFVLYDKQKDQPLCLTCIQEITGMNSFDQISKQLEEIKTHSIEEFQKEQQQLQQLLDSIQLYKQNLINGIDKIIQIVMDQIENIRSSKKQFDEQLQLANKQNTLDQLKIKLKDQEDDHNKIKIQMKKLLSDFQQKFINIDNLNQIITVNQLDSAEKADQINVCEVKQEQIQNLRKFQYEEIAKSGKKESNRCFFMAFSKDKTNLLVACGSKIKIYEFINGKIGKDLQKLSNHKKQVFCLYIMQQSNCFISGSDDESIIIWKQDSKGQWVPQQVLTGHKGQVNCLLMNKNEDLLISGSWDTTVKFWKKENEQWICHQTIKTDNTVYATNLNELENKLITCGVSANIYVMGIQNDKQWKIIQQIKVGEYGLRLCFTIKDQFVFQPRTKDYLEIYDFDSRSNQYRKISQVQIQSCKECLISFPCQFIKQYNILFVKHGQYLNIFQINENNNYELIQTITYDDLKYLCGIVSDDGQYLITWDQGSKEIQVRSIQFKNEQFQ